MALTPPDRGSTPPYRFLASRTLWRIENILDGFAGVKPHCFAGGDFDGFSALWIPPIACRLAIFSTGVASLAGVPVYIMLAKKFDTRC